MRDLEEFFQWKTVVNGLDRIVMRGGIDVGES